LYGFLCDRSQFNIHGLFNNIENVLLYLQIAARATTGGTFLFKHILCVSVSYISIVGYYRCSTAREIGIIRNIQKPLLCKRLRKMEQTAHIMQICLIPVY
jgi:hypothetical protein